MWMHDWLIDVGQQTLSSDLFILFDTKKDDGKRSQRPMQGWFRACYISNLVPSFIFDINIT